MVFEKRFNALVIDPNLEARSVLKELLHNEQQYGNLVYQGVYIVSTFMEAMIRISEVSEIDVIFISCKFPVSEIELFIKTAKENENQRGTAYILVMNVQEQGGALVAQGMALGGDGFLILPCSVEKLREITLIAQRVKEAAHERMMRVALTLLIDTILGEIETKVDEFYKLGRVTHFRRQFKEATVQLLHGSKETRSQYLEILQERLALAAPRRLEDRCFKSEKVWQRKRAKPKNDTL